MNVKFLGPGCRSCQNLEARTRDALDHLGLQSDVEKVTDYAATVGYGVMKTPGLVVDDTLVVSGRGPAVDEITAMLRSTTAS